MKKQTTIRLTVETREKLKRLGRKGETYEQIVSRILEEIGK